MLYFHIDITNPQIIAYHNFVKKVRFTNCKCSQKGTFLFHGSYVKRSKFENECEETILPNSFSVILNPTKHKLYTSCKVLEYFSGIF